MKLFLIKIDNGKSFEDYLEEHKLIVAEDKAVASVKAVEFMNCHFGYVDELNPGSAGFEVTTIDEVDGYEIEVMKKASDSK